MAVANRLNMRGFDLWTPTPVYNFQPSKRTGKFIHCGNIFRKSSVSKWPPDNLFANRSFKFGDRFFKAQSIIRDY